MSLVTLQQELKSGRRSSKQLVEIYLSRVDADDRHGPAVNAVIEINPDAMVIADRMDAERKAKGPRKPWHGTPVLSKDNIETAEVTRRGKGQDPELRISEYRDRGLVSGLTFAVPVVLL